MSSFSCVLHVDMVVHLYVYCHVRMELFGVGPMWVLVFINVRSLGVVMEWYELLYQPHCSAVGVYFSCFLCMVVHP